MSVRRRLPLVMRAFPGMTPAAVWDLPYLEWLVVAQAAEAWAEDQRQQQQEIERMSRR